MNFTNGGMFKTLDSIEAGCVSCPSCANWVSCSCDGVTLFPMVTVAQGALYYWTLSARIENSANAAGVITPGNTVEPM